MQNDFWVEGAGTPSAPSSTGINYATLSSFLSGSDETLGRFRFNGLTTGFSTYSLLLEPGFVSDLENGRLVSLRVAPADDSIAYLFNSRSFGTVVNRPVLTITAIPEPTTAVLCGLFLVTVLATRRKTP
jgi:hypothetical protein